MSLASLVTAGIMVYRAYRIEPRQVRSQTIVGNGEASRSYAEAAATAAESWQLALERIEEMQTEITQQRGISETRFRQLADMVRMYQEYQEYLLDGIKRLTGQIVSTGQSPVWEPKLFTIQKDKE